MMKAYIKQAFDVETIIELLEQEKLSQGDTLLFMDHSNYGPFCSEADFAALIDSMADKPCDFWGLICEAERLDENWQVVPKRLSQGFLAVRSSLFSQPEFRAFFTSGRDMDEFLTYFSSLGYTYDVAIDISEFQSDKPEFNLDCERFMPYELLKKGYPFISKKCFQRSDDDFSYSNGESLPRAMAYIKSQGYNVDEVYRDSLAHNKIADLRYLLKWNYILPAGVREGCCDLADVYKKTVVIAHLFYMDLLAEEFAYIAAIPEEIKVVVTSLPANHGKLHKWMEKIGRQNYVLLEASTRGRDVGALLVTAREYIRSYEYICFVHDKKTAKSFGAFPIGESFRYQLWENMLKSSCYIDNVLDTLQKNPRLGLLAPPEPVQGDYFALVANAWAGSLRATQKLLEKIAVDIELTQDNPPFALGTCFWCKRDALAPLFNYDFTYEAFPPEPLPIDGTISHGIERCLSFVAQSQGYYSGIVETSEYGSLQLVNLQRMLSDVVAKCSKEQYFNNFAELCGAGNHLLDFCQEYEEIYIYGAGVAGQRLAKLLLAKKMPVAGFMVSDGYTFPEESPLPCYHLSEVQPQENRGVIVAGTRGNKSAMLEAVQQQGWVHVYCRY